MSYGILFTCRFNRIVTDIEDILKNNVDVEIISDTIYDINILIDLYRKLENGTLEGRVAPVFLLTLCFTIIGLTLSQASPCFYVFAVCLLKTLWEKEKLLMMSNFSSSHSNFYLFSELSAIFIKFKIVVCKLSQFGSV